MRNAFRHRILLAVLASSCFIGCAMPGAASAQGEAHELRAASCTTLAFSSYGSRSTDSRGRLVEKVRVTATLLGGKQIVEVFPYDWFYENPRETDPFYGKNRYRSDMVMIAQRPPRGFPDQLPPLIAYVLSRTDRKGGVHVRPCPVPSTPQPVGYGQRFMAGLLIIRDVTSPALPVAILPNFATPTGDVQVCASLRNRDTRTLTSYRILITFFGDASHAAIADETLQRNVTLHRGEADGPMKAEEFVGGDYSKNCVPFAKLPALRKEFDRVKRVEERVILLRFSDGTELRG